MAKICVAQFGDWNQEKEVCWFQWAKWMHRFISCKQSMFVIHIL